MSLQRIPANSFALLVKAAILNHTRGLKLTATVLVAVVESFALNARYNMAGRKLGCFR